MRNPSAVTPSNVYWRKVFFVLSINAGALFFVEERATGIMMQR